MVRSVIAGSGMYVPAACVTNAMLSRIMDTSDDWIRERSGVETRHFADPGTTTTDLAYEASLKAIESAAIAREEIDLIVFATMTPDHYFPGCGGLLQSRLGLKGIAAFDIRQQCAGFLYGLRLADAHIRSGMARTVLVIGAESHIGFMPWTVQNFEYVFGRSDIPPTAQEYEWNSRFRHLTVLFGDAGAAVIVKASENGNSGIIDSLLHTDGTDYDKLFVPGVGFRHRPYVDSAQLSKGEHIPVMDGRYVFKSATTRMAEVARKILERNNYSTDDLSLVLMHQANKRINEYVQKSLGLPDQKVIHNIHKYGNTTAATIPLLWQEAAAEGRIAPGALVLMVAFGAGMNWGAVLIRV